ncbi:molybdopterin-dependent oxidoreductase [Myxococcota bacterium]|nr:molybdopterin-dependent oxidoreductase [Myxococcota bacterium]MBU1899864.1 molybdopterin-dependent oxidoreductase [Myxococcota bacterium]
MSLSRREFIKIGAGATAAVGLGSGLVTQWWGLDNNPIPNPNTEGDRIVPTFCELCFWKCGVLAHVKKGPDGQERVVKITGNPDHPLSRGKLCPRGTGGTGLLYDPDRLKQPLVRTKSKRGEDIFEAVSWETALDEVAAKLMKVKEEHGPEALALFSHGFGGSWFKHLLKAMGSKNIAAPSYAQCRGPREVGYWLTFGSGIGSPEAVDAEHARCIVLMGSHLGENMHNTHVQDFSRAIDRGADIIVVDPRYSTAASKARHWLPIKPGTDIALLLAWMHVIITEKRYDADYIQKHAIGFDELKKHVEAKTPEWAYPITGIRPEKIRETARLMAGAAPATLIHPGRRSTWYGDDTQRERGKAILAALLGSWGREGGYLIPSKMSVQPYPDQPYAQTPKAALDRVKEGLYPLADETLASGLCDISVPGEAAMNLKGWIVYGTNLIQSLPDYRKTVKAIQALDFIVTVDVLPAEICGWSDVVLPESTYLERTDDLWNPGYREPFVAMRQQAVEPLYQSKPGWWMAKELANRMGLAAYFPWKDSLEYVRERATRSGLDFDTLQAKGVVKGAVVPTTEEQGLTLSFDTESGKIELYNQTLKNLGFDPIPDYYPVEEPPAGSFRLITGRAPMHTFGRTTNNRFLSECYDENEVWVNADVAKGLGFKNGDRVILVNQDEVRSEPISLRATQRVRGDAVYIVHGYGHTAEGLKFAYKRGASDSLLTTNYKVDPIMGGTGMNVNFVRIEGVA